VWEVVPFSWGTDNPQALMKAVPGESDLWEYEFNPEELFDLDAAEIDRIGIVFRNADGTKEGKPVPEEIFLLISFRDLRSYFCSRVAIPSSLM
jgi:hypothetical protein